MEPILAEVPTELTAHRLHLRIPRIADAPALAAAVRASLPELKPWLPWATDKYDNAESDGWIRRTIARSIAREGATYGIFDVATGDALGGVGAETIDWKVRKCEIGYWIRTEVAGRGLMREAVTAVVKAFEQLGLRRIQLRCDPRNLRSAAVARRCGFQHEGTLREDGIDANGVRTSTMVFSRLMGDVTDAAPVAEPLQSSP